MVGQRRLILFFQLQRDFDPFLNRGQCYTFRFFRFPTAWVDNTEVLLILGLLRTKFLGWAIDHGLITFSLSSQVLSQIMFDFICAHTLVQRRYYATRHSWSEARAPNLLNVHKVNLLTDKLVLRFYRNLANLNTAEALTFLWKLGVKLIADVYLPLSNIFDHSLHLLV